MATKKKPKKKALQSKKTALAKPKPSSTKKRTRKAATSKKPGKKTAVRPKKVAAKKKELRKRTPAKAKGKVESRRISRKAQARPAAVGTPGEEADVLSGEESGDLQGLSNRESADSESVDELLEEGNAFEAGVVDGVEDADENDEREVHTRELPEDDVPGEYLDED